MCLANVIDEFSFAVIQNWYSVVETHRRWRELKHNDLLLFLLHSEFLTLADVC
jgi:hypothetical protein